ncbi:carotenoid oxygenase family protein [Streptomyces griseofuscus]|uniref:carotenoid oxygenase family protein n=1 Tax=Streptomyces griseofuscus TaxID=146922 RepID=UPI002482E2F4|nr:carotenoid oxygenase family protein [Streptomyces griseofuscus]
MWEQQHPARLGVMPHLGDADQIQWVEVPRCHVFHVLNAYDKAEGSRTLDVIRYDEVFLRHLHGPGGRVPILGCWVVNPATGGVDKPFDDLAELDRGHRGGVGAGVQADRVQRRRP